MRATPSTSRGTVFRIVNIGNCDLPGGWISLRRGSDSSETLLPEWGLKFDRRLLQTAKFNLLTGVVPTTAGTSAYRRDPDVQLMLRVREGDESAFAQLVKKYQDRLIGVFTNMFTDPALAEDLAQEVFLRIYRARQGYEPTAKFSTWVFQIASNLASNSRRSKSRKKEVQFHMSASGSQPLRSADQLVPEKSALMPTRQLDSEELRERVQAAMDTLNERQRLALLLHKFEGMNYTDIGETLEMSPQAVKSLLSRARENLRIALENYIG